MKKLYEFDDLVIEAKTENKKFFLRVIQMYGTGYEEVIWESEHETRKEANETFKMLVWHCKH